MLKRFVKRINLNFKHSRSERVASNSYSNYHQRIKKIFTNVNPFKKLNNKYDKS